MVGWRRSGAPIGQLFNGTILHQLQHTWGLTSSPIVTADWTAAPGQQWTVPVGGGFGRVFKVGDQPIDASVQGFYNVDRPDNGPTWSLRVQVSLLFPDR